MEQVRAWNNKRTRTFFRVKVLLQEEHDSPIERVRGLRVYMGQQAQQALSVN